MLCELCYLSTVYGKVFLLLSKEKKETTFFLNISLNFLYSNLLNRFKMLWHHAKLFNCVRETNYYSEHIKLGLAEMLDFVSRYIKR